MATGRTAAFARGKVANPSHSSMKSRSSARSVTKAIDCGWLKIGVLMAELSPPRFFQTPSEVENTLPLVLGSLAGVIVLLLLILVLHIYIRERCIKQESTIHGTLPRLPVRSPIRDNGAADDHLYVDVRNDSDTTKLHSDKKGKNHLTGENSHEIYTNYQEGRRLLKEWGINPLQPPDQDTQAKPQRSRSPRKV
ncbi:Hypothetical predicted protein [Pelobates cultripes]|uniref:Uncharacterized protein n=1 Tax=Pelobates cultripes TaxID=61616 RepID=A0AAD1T3Y3_PELCU|nr:Hypothetical predicted protein [Pelobates cultripes]